MGFADYISSLSFSILQPDTGRTEDRRLAVPRRAGDDAKLVGLPGAGVDVLNLDVPQSLESLYGIVAPQARIARMSTFAMGTLVNRAVAAMPPGHSYVNVGTWAGFSLWAGMAGHPDRTCVGIDDFSQYGGPRDAFYESFDRLRSPNHHFHEMDYRDYFARVHEGPIGLYFYDGAHSYEHQLLGLQAAERFFGDECVVMVDDTNRVDPYRATYDFIAGSEREYTVLLDQQTAGNEHPTFWNGVLVLQATARTRSAGPPKGDQEPWQWAHKHYDPVPVEPKAPLISLVLRNSRSSPARIQAAIEDALAQQWPSLELVVADERPRVETQEVVARYSGRVAYVPSGGGDADGKTALARAIDATHGEYVAFADAEDRLHASAVWIGVADPRWAEFTRPRTERLIDRLARSLEVIAAASAVVPRGSSCALSNGRLPVPAIDNGREIAPFLDRRGKGAAYPPDEETALERLAALRSSGTAFLAVGWRSFEWFERFPRFRDELEARSTRVLETDDVWSSTCAADGSTSHGQMDEPRQRAWDAWLKLLRWVLDKWLMIGAHGWGPLDRQGHSDSLKRHPMAACPRSPETRVISRGRHDRRHRSSRGHPLQGGPRAAGHPLAAGHGVRRFHSVRRAADDQGSSARRQHHNLVVLRICAHAHYRSSCSDARASTRLTVSELP